MLWPWEGAARPRLRADSTAQMASAGKATWRQICLPPSVTPRESSYYQRHDLGQVPSLPEEACFLGCNLKDLPR